MYPTLLKGGDKRRTEKVRQFLEEAGVQEIGEYEKIESILEAYYVKDAKPLDEEERLKHMAMFVSYVKSDGDVSVFGERTYFLFLDRNKSWRVPPSMCYLDTPFYDTSLAALYEAGKAQSKLKYSLWEEYQQIHGFVEFAKAIGVIYKLKEIKTSIANNPDRSIMWSESGYGKPSGYGIDEDYSFENLAAILGKKSVAASGLLWKTMCSASSIILRARYRKNKKPPEAEAPSQLVHHLKDYDWIPDKEGKFYKPSDISQEMLPNDFPYDNRNGWLTAVGFGERARQQTEEYRLKQRVLKEAGIPSEVSEMFSGLTEEGAKQKAQEFREFERLKKRSAGEGDNKTSSDSSETGSSDTPTPNFSEAFEQAFSRPGVNLDEAEYVDAIPSGNFDRRRARTAEEIREDVAKEPLAVERFRQVPRKVWESKNNGARTQLREAYGGKCQICGDSFQKRDGERYFEGVYIVSLTKARWIDRWGNLLCLCPKHSAMFEHGSVVADDIQEQVNACDLSDDTPRLEVELCGEEVQIQFARKHMLDLQEMMKVSSDE